VAAKNGVAQTLRKGRVAGWVALWYYIRRRARPGWTSI
jgi:hypothetical protein